MADITLTCRESSCRQDFVFTEGEQAFFEQRQFTPPTRCKACRQRRKQEKAEQDARGGK